MHIVLAALAVLLIGVIVYIVLWLADRLVFFRRRPTTAPPIEGKWFDVTVTDTDGQWHRFRLGCGDAVGYAGIRIDVDYRNCISLTHYTEPDASPTELEATRPFRVEY